LNVIVGGPGSLALAFRRQLRQAEPCLQDEEDRPAKDANASTSTITAGGSETTTSRRATLTHSPNWSSVYSG
jgi:hypothetical protein